MITKYYGYQLVYNYRVFNPTSIAVSFNAYGGLGIKNSFEQFVSINDTLVGQGPYTLSPGSSVDIKIGYIVGWPLLAGEIYSAKAYIVDVLTDDIIDEKILWDAVFIAVEEEFL